MAGGSRETPRDPSGEAAVGEGEQEALALEEEGASDLQDTDIY